jgi:hypothetical protein
MSIENQPSKKKRNKPLIFALIGAGALVASIGGVFATNSITINSNGSIEFGQGLSATSTCDADLTTTINQAYNAGTGIFDATEVVVSGIKDFACDGKTLHVSLVDSAGTVCGVDGTNGSAPNQDSFLIADGGTTGTDDDLTKTVTIEANCDASTITKVAITTS